MPATPTYPYQGEHDETLLYKIAWNLADIDKYGGAGGGLPSQTGQSGNFLTTNGTAASWSAITGGGTVTHTLGNLTSGQVIIGNGAGDVTVGGTLGTNAFTSTAYSPVAGSSSIATVGTLTSGTWNAGVIGPAYGGAGVANNAANTITFSGNFGLTLTLGGATSLTLPASGTIATTSVATLSSLTSVGTIATGVWQGTAVAAGYGGTGGSSAASTGIAQVSSGTWSYSTALASGTTATTQATNVSNTTVATTAYVTPATSALGVKTTAVTFDWSASTSFSVTLTAANACVPTFTNAVDGETITIAVTTAATASINWAGGTGTAIKWTGAAGAPTQSTAGNIDFYTFKKVGSVLVGAMVTNMG